MNPQKEDVGVLNAYEFDLAFGSDENSFELIVSENVLNYGYYVYFEGTEYGGIVDSIHVDTSSDAITYKGRTWHGILEKKVIIPDDGTDYFIVNGEVNEVIGQIITRLDLDDIFEASEEDSELEVSNYNFPRFIPGYAGIKKMLASVYAKLKIEFIAGKVRLSAIPRIDYSQDEEFDSTQVQFSITKNNRPLNHLICLGSGELKNRHVIHLFCDNNGGIQPYAHKLEPMEDADYILDTSQQVLFDDEEFAEVYDYSNAGTIINYILLGENDEPENWDLNFNKYYLRDEEGYKQLESWQEEVYSDILIKPADWDANFKEYFTLDSNGNYVNVTSVNQVSYDLQTNAPADYNSKYKDYYYLDNGQYKSIKSVMAVDYQLLDIQPEGWEKGYNNFYYYFTDGVHEEYRRVPAVVTKIYNMQSVEPTDWDAHFDDYYIKKAKGNGFEKVRAEGQDNPTYKAQSKAPEDWKKNYSNYYYVYTDGSTSEYRKVQGEQKTKFVLQAQKPSNWSESSTSYYTKNSNGSYVAVQGTPKKEYTLLSVQPANWATHYFDYFVKTVDNKSYVQVAAQATVPEFRNNTYYNETKATAAPPWKKSTYYTRTTYSIAPTWEKNKYYTKENPKVPKWKKSTYYTEESINSAPVWKSNMYYACIQKEVAPIWQSGKYYTKNVVTVPQFAVGTYFKKTIETMWHAWQPDTYYRAAEDNYSDLIANAMERLNESTNCDELEIDFNADSIVYDIGDIVGASDTVTGLSLWQPITKKIVTIKNDVTTISYKVGD